MHSSSSWKTQELWPVEWTKMYSHIIASSGVAKIKAYIVCFNVQHVENKSKAHLTIISIIFFLRYVKLHTVKDSQVYLKSQHRKDLLLGVAVVDTQYMHIPCHSLKSVFVYTPMDIFLTFYIYIDSCTGVSMSRNEDFTDIYIICAERRGLLKSARQLKILLLGMSRVCTHVV